MAWSKLLNTDGRFSVIVHIPSRVEVRMEGAVLMLVN